MVFFNFRQKNFQVLLQNIIFCPFIILHLCNKKICCNNSDYVRAFDNKGIKLNITVLYTIYFENNERIMHYKTKQ